MFELSQLRCFVAAAEELHFGRAAQRLNMTQSPLSRQIQLLERILGLTLLERTSRNVALTPAGRVFLIEARRIVRLAESAALSARRVAHGEAGRIAIGFTAVSGYSLIPQIVAQARASLPHIGRAPPPPIAPGPGGRGGRQHGPSPCPPFSPPPPPPPRRSTARSSTRPRS